MDAWLRGASPEDRDDSLTRVQGIIARIPKDVLLGALQAMRTQRATFGYGVDIERLLAERLAQIATATGDAELARTLLDADAGALVIPGDAGIALGELATSRRGLNVVEGRTVGLLLPTESPALRDESADALRGVMWALGLPRGVRTLGPAPAATDARTVARSKEPRAPCASPKSAPALGDPRPDEALRLVTRDDAGRADRTEVALDELAGEGSAVIIAGLDGDTSARALKWGEAHAVPIVVLVPPTPAVTPGAFGFVLGESRASVIAMLAASVPSLMKEPVAPVVDASELALFPPQGGPFDGLVLVPPVSCDMPPVRAGDPRFPITQWDRDKVRAWLVSGAPDCARDVVSELSAAHMTPAGRSGGPSVVALTLEAAGTPKHATGLRVVSASAGIVPIADASEATDDEVRRFVTIFGGASWWTALGRDAATLARVAIDALPADVASDAPAVAGRRDQARDRLAAARTRLWSTEATGFAGATRTVERTLCAIDVPAR
jgi:hypothetical protein